MTKAIRTTFLMGALAFATSFAWAPRGMASEGIRRIASDAYSPPLYDTPEPAKPAASSSSAKPTSSAVSSAHILPEESGIADFKNPQSTLNREVLGELAQTVAGSAMRTDDGEPASDNPADQKPSWLVSRLQKEFNRYKISLSIGKKGEIITGNPDGLGIDAYYQVSIEPHFRNGEQIRRDMYVLGVGLGKNGLGGTKISVGAKAYIRLTFSRIFSGPNAKWDALWVKPYLPVAFPEAIEQLIDPDKEWTDKLPLDVNDVKTKLRKGEAVRFEIVGSLSGGLGTSHVAGSQFASAGLSTSKEAIFMVDLFKHSATQARLRLLSVLDKNRITFSASTGILPNISILRRLGAWLSFDAYQTFNGLGLQGIKDFPVDSMVVDYLYRFADARPQPLLDPESGEAALDELLKNISRFKFLPLLSLVHDEQMLETSLEEYAGKSEIAARVDKPLGDAARVKHLFKGRIWTTMRGMAIEARLSQILKGKDSGSSTRSFVISTDEDGRQSHFILESANRAYNASAFFGRWRHSTSQNVDALVQSNEKLEAKELVDIVSTLEIRDNDFDTRKLRNLRTRLLGDGQDLRGIIPQALQKPDIVNFLPMSKQHGGYFKMKAAYATESFTKLGKLSKPEIHQRLYKFLDNHPERSLMNLPCDVPQASLSLSEYTDQISTLIHRSFSAEFSLEHRMASLRLLMGENLFQSHLIYEFFPQFIDENQLVKNLGVALQFMSSETPSKSKTAGQNDASSVYSFATLVRNVLNDRSNDLRLETLINDDDTKTLVIPQMKSEAKTEPKTEVKTEETPEKVPEKVPEKTDQ